MQGISKWSALTAAAVTLLASTAQAQQWNSLPALGNNTWQANGSSTAYWNNFSDDGRNCNIGYVLTGAATGCANQRPTNWLPFNGPVAQQYFSADGQAAMAFTFRAGLYNISQLGSSSLGGDIAGANTTWGFFDANGMTQLPNNQNFTQQVLFTSDWGFYITLDRPTVTPRINALSNNASYARHFSVLGTSGSSYTSQSGVARLYPGQNQTVYVGMEDNGCTALSPTCTRVSDYDNNDVIFAVTSVPEPSTYALMAAGLAALGFAARRRRNA